MTIAQIRKALIAAGAAGLFALVSGLAAGLSDGHLSGNEIGVAIGLALGAIAATGPTVFAVPNAPSAAEAATGVNRAARSGLRRQSQRAGDNATQTMIGGRDDRGAVSIEYLIGLLVVVVLVLVVLRVAGVY